MNQQLDEKKQVIISILMQLRARNSEIGQYERSMMNSNFNYSVKLNNGRIELPETLIYDYERAPAYITEDRFREAAGKFVPNGSKKTEEVTRANSKIENEKKDVEIKTKRSMRMVWIALIIFLLVLIAYLIFF